MSPSPLRIGIIDDSAAMQELFKLMLKPQPDCEIVWTAKGAEEGWRNFAGLQPDVVLLDLELPDRPGMDVLRRIMRERPTPVVVVSANGGEGTENTVTALANGAVAFVEKPDSITISVEQFMETFNRVVRLAAEKCRPSASVAPALDPGQVQAVTPTQLLRDKVVAVGASTGGVAAVEHVLTALNRAPLPILVTQHMPPGYTKRFAERLQRVTGYKVKEAEDGDKLAPGVVLIAPGDRHMVLSGSRVAPVCRLTDGPPISGHKPSVDVTFGSVAEVMGPQALGVLLTGMGRDGAEGLLAMRQAGAQTASESEASAIVYGMPKAAVELGASDVSLPLQGVARWITLAAKDNAAARPAGPAPGSVAPDLRGKAIDAFRVLVVDDQKSMRGLAANCLQQLGFRHVDEAASGEEALRVVTEKGYDLMLADWNMDGMSGLDLVKAVRKERNPRQMVILMTTSESHISKVQAAMDAGANNYLVKPCDAPKLRQRLERALMRRLA